MARERKFSTVDLYQSTKHLLLEHGYDGFTFSMLANRLDISRGALYKYFENKEVLISEYMVFEMKKFMVQLHKIQEYKSFEEKFDYLIHLIFHDQEIHRLREIGLEIPRSPNTKVHENQEQLDQLHYEMYTSLQSFVELGKQEGIIKPSIPNGLFLGFIFQTIAIPNHENLPYSEWVSSIKEILRHGMFKI
ncbi:transcriptional regulator, TetR family [Oceanobacillus limi]|uniref:Transcriptional regulator, TetR family n=1 Tax=Oceanobacillus limi TaxID=930131 RepID=A0A1I0B5T5_9BACI|nr:TetR/AcrR family transcriptional regulator [Oceanobacillus limi]SET01359.1 transcriptional regulator, TetR family [Oceanobacillus limi]